MRPQHRLGHSIRTADEHGAFQDFLTLTERDLPASMPAWLRTLFGSPVVGNAHGSCDRERRCAEQIRIAIVLIGARGRDDDIDPVAAVAALDWV